MPTHRPNLRELSQVELSAATGCSKETVRRRLAMPPAIEPSRIDGRTVWYRAPEALARILGPAARVADGDGEVLDLAAERAALARAQTIAQELRNAESVRQVIPRDEVLRHWASMTLNAKEKLRSIPAVAMTRVPGCTKAQARAIGELIDEALTELGSGRNGVPPHRTVRRPHRKLRSPTHDEAPTDAA